MTQRQPDPPRPRAVPNVVMPVVVVGAFVASGVRHSAWWCAVGALDLAGFLAIAYAATAYPRVVALARFNSLLEDRPHVA